MPLYAAFINTYFTSPNNIVKIAVTTTDSTPPPPPPSPTHNPHPALPQETFSRQQATSQNFRSCGVISKNVREKSRECHNHKPQPFPDTKRKRKQTKPNKSKSNKCTKSTKISFLMHILSLFSSTM